MRNKIKENTNKTRSLNKEVVPVISLHDVPPVDLLLFDFPSTHSGASARGGFGAIQSGNRTGERGVVGVGWVICQAPHLL